ncbi:hypothetical protein ACFL21_05115 [Patescibacteria group bacterium]
MNFAQPNWDNIQILKVNRPMGQGSSTLKKDRPGPGVRAWKLSKASELRLFNKGFSRDEIERLKGYREAVEMALNGEDHAKVRDLILNTWEQHKDALSKGGFLFQEVEDTQWDQTTDQMI